MPASRRPAQASPYTRQGRASVRSGLGPRARRRAVGRLRRHCQHDVRTSSGSIVTRPALRLLDAAAPGARRAPAPVPAPGERLPAVVLGRGGSAGVVFANQSASVACGSRCRYARAVARDGVRSIVFDYAAASRADEVLAATRWLRAHGATRVVLAARPRSAGALSHRRRARRARQVDAVVSLSGDASRRAARPARRCPTLRVGLWVTRRTSRYTTSPSDDRASSTAARAGARDPTACSSSRGDTSGRPVHRARRHRRGRAQRSCCSSVAAVIAPRAYGRDALAAQAAHRGERGRVVSARPPPR